MHIFQSARLAGIVVLLAAFVAPAAAGLAPEGRGRGGQLGAPAVVSPEVSTDRRITFRINAPQAQAVRVSGGDIPGLGQNGVMTKGENGVWTFTSAAVPPGAYRYNINVDGVTVIDPRNPLTSVSNNHVWSLALVPGSDLFDTKQVPHGAVASVTYYSAPLQRHRRMRARIEDRGECGLLALGYFRVSVDGHVQAMVELHAAESGLRAVDTVLRIQLRFGVAEHDEVTGYF